MTVVCLWQLGHSSGAVGTELGAALLERAPRVKIEHAGKDNPDALIAWADARGLRGASLADVLLGLLRRQGCAAPVAGVAATPVAAEVAARHVARADAPLAEVPVGGDRAFLAPWPLDVLRPAAPLLSLLEGSGLERCADLAALDQAAVELRFGAEGVALWRLARADDRRLLFGPAPRPLPHASLEWTDYELHDPERLLFVVNRLVQQVCTALHELGQGARTFTLAFMLARGGDVEQPFNPSRPSADPRAWLRLIRSGLERLRLPAGAVGVALRVDAAQQSGSVQGDLLDRGFASARVAEEALARVVDRDGPLVSPGNTRHPLLRRRTEWREQEPALVWARPQIGAGDTLPELALHLLPEPAVIEVETTDRRGFAAPVRYRDAEGWHDLLTASGPDCISGGRWEDAWAYELYCCVRTDGELVQLARDARRDRWELQGSWR
jgi:protein ImuB